MQALWASIIPEVPLKKGLLVITVATGTPRLITGVEESSGAVFVSGQACSKLAEQYRLDLSDSGSFWYDQGFDVGWTLTVAAGTFTEEQVLHRKERF